MAPATLHKSFKTGTTHNIEFRKDNSETLTKSTTEYNLLEFWYNTTPITDWNSSQQCPQHVLHPSAYVMEFSFPCMMLCSCSTKIWKDKTNNHKIARGRQLHKMEKTNKNLDTVHVLYVTASNMDPDSKEDFLKLSNHYLTVLKLSNG